VLSTVALVLVGLVAFEHLYILVLEMFLWTTPYGRRVFGTSAELAEQSKVLAANQGLYNGFLAAGLIWSFFLDAHAAHVVRVFFLSCVVVAGVYGGLTAVRRILYVQAGPAALALAAVLASA
jgi:putative membrane protein